MEKRDTPSEKVVPFRGVHISLFEMKAFQGLEKAIGKGNLSLVDEKELHTNMSFSVKNNSIT
jgi:hypothetical protein